MDAPRNNTDCYYFYYSTCLKGDRCPFRHEPSAINCETVCHLWQRGICLNQHCPFRHMALEYDCKSSPYYHKNQPRVLPKHHCSQHENPWLTPPEPNVQKEQSRRECITTSTHIKESKRKVLDIKLQHVQSELTSSYAHNNTRVEQKFNTVSSRWYGNGGNDLRAQILSKAAHRNSRADADFRVMTLDEIRRNKTLHNQAHCSDMGETATATVNPSRDIAAVAAPRVNKFKSVSAAKDSGDISESRFQRKQKICKSHYNFQVSRTPCGDKVTVMLNTKVNSECTVGHTVIESPTQIREEYISPENDTSSCSIPKSLVSNRLALKQTGNDLRKVGNGKEFLVSESNRNENGCFDQTNQMMSDTECKPRIRQRKRKNTDPAGGPPPKLSRFLRPTADSLKVSEVTPPVNGCSHFSKLDGNPHLDSGESSCFVLGQPLTKISEDSFRPCSVLLTSASICDKSSITSFNNARCGTAQNTDPSSQTTSPLITSGLPGKYPDSSYNGLENVIRVTHPSKSQSSQRLVSKLALSATSAKCVLDGKEEVLSIPQTGLGDTDTNEELLRVHDDNISSMTLGTEEDILRQIDDILNDSFL